MRMSFKLVDTENENIRGYIDVDVSGFGIINKVYFNGAGYEGAHFVRDFLEILIGQGYIARKLSGDESNEENGNGLSTF
jgi:hypothetical protein